MKRVATKITVYWDDIDSNNEGWAYRLTDVDGDIGSGVLDAYRDDMDDAIASAVAIAGLDIDPSEFDREELEGYAIWLSAE